MDARAEILARARRACRQVTPPQHAGARPGTGGTGDLPQRFQTELQSLAATFGRASRTQLAQAVASLLREEGVKRIAAWASPLLEELRSALPVAALDLAWTAPRSSAAPDLEHWRQACLAAEAGITAADYALADTGTLALRAGREQPRLASLLPPVHIAIVPAGRLLPDLGTLLRAIGTERQALTSCVTLISGPSRTADIEKKLVLGVHGPARLHVLLLE